MVSKCDDLSLSLRIPADRCFFENALMTLDGICEHCNVADDSAERVKSVFEAALDGSLKASKLLSPWMFDLKFSVSKNVLSITVDNYLFDDGDKVPRDFDISSVKSGLSFLSELTDSFQYCNSSENIASYNMKFNL